MIEAFIKDIDARWRWDTPKPIPLHVLGSAALMLQCSYTRGTKDSDVLETQEINKTTRERLEALAGKGTALHRRHRLYIDIIANGLPLLPSPPEWLPQPQLSQELEHFSVSVLSIVDVVVSKLKRLNANDYSDIDAMVEAGLVAHAAMISRAQSAIESAIGQEPHVKNLIRNLHRVERDLFDAEETEMELPFWMRL